MLQQCEYIMYLWLILLVDYIKTQSGRNLVPGTALHLFGAPRAFEWNGTFQSELGKEHSYASRGAHKWKNTVS